MANNSASSIRSAINTKLGEVTQLKQVAIGRSSNPSSGFPFCRFYLIGIDDELKDNTPSNFRTYRYAIEILQEMTSKSVADAEADFEDAMDAVLDKLNANWTLTANVDVSFVESGTIGVVESPQGPAIQGTIFLSCRTLIS